MSSKPHSQSAAMAYLYLEQGRYDDAIEPLKRAIAEDPSNATWHYYLALCLHQCDQEQEALNALSESLAIDPNSVDAHSLRASILCSLERPKEALESADSALAIDANSEFALLQRSRALCGLKRWTDAEDTLDEVIRINPENQGAANQLAYIYRMQGRQIDNHSQLDHLLSKHPDDAETHAAVGWSNLQHGDLLKAEQHFVEALRMDPKNRAARDGYLETLKSRSLVYRLHLRLGLFMSRFSKGAGLVAIIGIMILANLGIAFLQGTAGRVVLIAYSILVLWSHLAGSLGHLILLSRKLCWHMLQKTEIFDGLIAGGLLVVGISLAIVGLFLGHIWTFTGLWLAAIALPLAYVFDNPSTLGRCVFALATILIVSSGSCLLAEFLGILSLTDQKSGLLLRVCVYTFIISTWLPNSSKLNGKRMYVA